MEQGDEAAIFVGACAALLIIVLAVAAIGGAPFN